MEQYKEINRSLTLQNQELRQQVARFKQEIVLLNRGLMSEKQVRQVLNRHYVRFVAEVSKLCNDAMREFHQIIEDLLPDANASQSESLNGRSIPRRSVRLVQPTLRQLQDTECDKENRKPPNEDIEQIQISYVQTRRRRKADSSVDSQLENTPPVLVETINSSASLECIENPEQSAEGGIADLVSRDIDTIREENSADISQSLVYAPAPSIQSLSQSEIVDDSSIESTTLLPHETALPANERQIPSISIHDASRNVPSQIASRTIRGEQSTLTEDTIFDNFRTLKAISSTPYKPSGPKIVRQCSVRLKRLKPTEVLKRKDLSSEDSTKRSKGLENSPQKHKRRKNVICSKGISSPRILTSMTLIDRSSDINYSNNSLRPKRNAAPSNLKEPNINSKMRRNI